MLHSVDGDGLAEIDEPAALPVHGRPGRGEVADGREHRFVAREPGGDELRVAAADVEAVEASRELVVQG
jgi:hypothetical protein